MENKSELPSTINVSSLTCIDLADSDVHQSAVSLKQACMDCGFFYVINHGISEELKDEVFEQSKKFFALPLENKMKVLRNESHRGYSPAVEQKQIHGDYNKESFFMGTEGTKDETHGNKPFYRPNTWPDSDVMPGWQATMEKYHQEALQVSCISLFSVFFK